MVSSVAEFWAPLTVHMTRMLKYGILSNKSTKSHKLNTAIAQLGSLIFRWYRNRFECMNALGRYKFPNIVVSMPQIYCSKIHGCSVYNIYTPSRNRENTNNLAAKSKFIIYHSFFEIESNEKFPVDQQTPQLTCSRISSRNS